MKDVTTNHRIEADDVRTDDKKVERCLSWFAPSPSDFVGRYVVASSAAGTMITKDQTELRPSFQQPPGTFIELSALDADKMFNGEPNADAGEVAAICGMKQQQVQCVNHIPVAAVICPSTKCYAMLVVASSDRDKLFSIEHMLNAQIFDVERTTK